MPELPNSPPTPQPALQPDSSTALHDAAVISATQRWLEIAVIGLNLCPFAKAVHRKNQIRYVVSQATDREMLKTDLHRELLTLHVADPQEIDTTLLIHPNVLQDFFDYNGFLKIADRLIDREGLRGDMQIASFHPLYEFAHCAADAPENCSNRSPYPMLHLLREASIERAVAAFPEASKIYQRNIETLGVLGIDGWHRLWADEAKPVEKN
ncbi:MAG: DUF1415 domain-containing protein [Pseudomonadota bacterium]